MTPTCSNIPSETIEQGQTFSYRNLDNFVTDNEDPPSAITWTYTGNNQLNVEFTYNNVIYISTPNPQWTGSEIITFQATDTGGLTDTDTASFTVTSDNTPPTVGNIEDLGMNAINQMGSLNDLA